MSGPFDLHLILAGQFGQLLIRQLDELGHIGGVDIHREFGGVDDGHRGVTRTAQGYTLTTDGGNLVVVGGGGVVVWRE